MDELKVKSKHMPSDIVNNYDYRMRFLNSALLLAESSGKTIRDAFYKMKNVSEKDGQADLVTETDKTVEQHIFATLKAEYPSHSFIGEESVSNGASSKLTSTPTWIVDPIDGTTNFVHMFPYVAVSIGLVIEKKVELGVVYAPILDDWYVALRGYGAFLNGKRLRIHNPPPALDKALIAFEWGANRDKKIVNTKAKNLVDTLLNHKVHGIRCMGSAALDMCLVGRGSVDLYFEWGPHCWDFAAASLVVEESGGVCTTTTGKPFDLMSCMIIAASSKALIEELVPSLTQIAVKRDDE